MAEGVQLCRWAGWSNGSILVIPSAVFCARDIVKAGATNLLVGLET